MTVLHKPELSLIVHALRQLLREQRNRWNELDKLYNEHFYLEGQLARLMCESGEIDSDKRQRIWADVDSRAAEYDDRCLDRWLIKDFINDVIKKIITIQREENNGTKFVATGA